MTPSWSMHLQQMALFDSFQWLSNKNGLTWLMCPSYSDNGLRPEPVLEAIHGQDPGQRHFGPGMLRQELPPPHWKHLTQNTCSAAKSFLTLHNCSPPGSSVHGISQARTLEWVVVSSSRGFSWPRDQTYVAYIGRQVLYHWATREAHGCVLSWGRKERREKRVGWYHLFLSPFYPVIWFLIHLYIRPWDFPGKNTGVGCHFLLQGIFPTQGSNQVSCIVARRFTIWATRQDHIYIYI